VIETGTEVIKACRCKRGAQGIGQLCDGIFKHRWLLGLCSGKARIKTPIQITSSVMLQQWSTQGIKTPARRASAYVRVDAHLDA
jgi:hypothetical protein